MLLIPQIKIEIRDTMLKRVLLGVLALLTLLAFSNDTKNVVLEWGVRIPMRDSVELNATIYRPSGDQDKLPVIFTFTPYISDSYHSRAYYFAQHGYIFALVDVRGRGNSDGKFEPMRNEGKDGYDVVEWLARQPWSNGKITMWGGSYAGYDQWSTLKEFPPHLATIVPVAAAHPGTDFPFFKNIFYSYVMQWLTYTSGNAGNPNLFGESSFWIQKFREMYLQHAPFQRLDKIVGNTSTHFQTWLQHPIPDAYYDAMNPTTDDYRNFDLPILTITGHYDGDQPGAFEYYKRHMQYGSPQSRKKHYLIVGPWDHAGTRTPQKEVGGLTFGEASLLDMNKLHTEWYDWTLKGGKKPEFLKNQIAYYIAGAEKWKYADSLESISDRKLILHLHSQNAIAGDVFHSGKLLSSPAAKQQPDSFVYNPLDVRPAELEKEEVKPYLTDQRYALNLYGNGVVYHSEPFQENTEITGFAKLILWMEMDVPDTDFQASIYEILPDGQSILLTSDLLRARYRESLRKETLVVPGEINRYEFSAFPFFSRQIAGGSRIRLVVSCLNSIYWQKNYNSGGVIAEESAKDARTAHIKVYHDEAHPASLELPVVTTSSK